MILAIDPGNVESAYVLVCNDLSKIIEKGKIYNMDLLPIIRQNVHKEHIAIEMIASYGMAVGQTVFDTCLWIGRYLEAADLSYQNIKLIYRKEVKMNLCGNTKAKDGNITQALKDRFGEVGVKKNPGYFYGVSKDIWSAMGVAVTYHDLYLSGGK